MEQVVWLVVRRGKSQKSRKIGMEMDRKREYIAEQIVNEVVVK